MLGPAQGQPQDHDLSEDGEGSEELQPHGRDCQGAPQAHLPVQPGHPEQAGLCAGARVPALPARTGGSAWSAEGVRAEQLRRRGARLARLVRTVPAAGRI